MSDPDAALEKIEFDFTKAEVEGSWADWQATEETIPPWWRAAVSYVLAHAEYSIRAPLVAMRPDGKIRHQWNFFVKNRAHHIYGTRLLPYESKVTRGDRLISKQRALDYHRYVDKMGRARLAVLLLERATPNAPVVEGHGLAEGRDSRLRRFVEQHQIPFTAVDRAAKVSKTDRQKWRHGRMKNTSVTAQRIERVLDGRTPLLSSDLTKAKG